MMQNLIFLEAEMYIKLNKICRGVYDYSLLTSEEEELRLTSCITSKQEAMKMAKKLAKNLNIKFRGN